MPPGSLGRILEIGRQLAAIQRTDRPVGKPALVAVFAADHGIARAGVSAYPAEVTGQMLANFAAGGAAINVLARTAGADLLVADFGVAHRPTALCESPSLRIQPIRDGTSSFHDRPAMSREEAYLAVERGLRLGEEFLEAGRYRVIALGEMGIGNSTTAAALIAALTGCSAEAVVGRGTGLDEAGLKRKLTVLRDALELHRVRATGVWDWLECVGGFEILGLAGLAIAAARGRALVVLDGLISTAAGLVATRLCPTCADYFLAAHMSPEPGHRVALEALKLRPLLDLGLRLGEGSGSAIALPMIAAAADILRDMATFDSAGVSEPPSCPPSELRP
jgi:nicotinate-nucleotide--dimethylbenzimidazole phosphoribosyltransferase